MPPLFSFLAPLLLLFAFTVKAETITDEETWVNLNAFVKLNEKWQIYGEYQPRFFDYQKYNGVVLHRGAIGRKVGHGFSAWVGLGLIVWNQRNQSKFPAKNQHEDRPFLMLMHAKELGSWKITNRTRFEQRMFRHTDEGSRRLRHQLRGQYKFGDSPWAIAAWDEWFYNTNDIYPSARSHAPVTKEGFDQNRAFLGMAYLFGDKQQHIIETGYMNNYVHGPTRDRNAHVWMTTFTGNL
ncbi:MAG TPA: DUF2490 domain-containing protein [Bacteriovoracaceae bacterium]|nr:DUF2490 domain-containing protein [Bacteriovoracaceae bacterium]